MKGNKISSKFTISQFPSARINWKPMVPDLDFRTASDAIGVAAM